MDRKAKVYIYKIKLVRGIRVKLTVVVKLVRIRVTV